VSEEELGEGLMKGRVARREQYEVEDIGSAAAAEGKRQAGA
jgi:hypothetical protein